MSKKIRIELGQWEMRFIFKALAVALSAKQKPFHISHRDKEYMTKLGDKLFKIYTETYGTQTDTRE